MSDLISREKAIMAARGFFSEYTTSEEFVLIESIVKVLELMDGEKQDSCEDCVSREAVNKLVDELARAISDEKSHIQRGRNYGIIMRDIWDLPSVTPERPHGKWIRAIDPDVNAWTGGHTCSECGRACVQMSMKYCANCGAEMKGEHT